MTTIANLSTVSYVKSGHVAYVEMNRPDVLNAMNLAMHAELARVWDVIEADDEIWAVVLSGAGDRSFSVGQELKELAVRIESRNSYSSFGSFGKPGYPRLTERFDFAKPIIAQVDGYALGGGFELALACDIIIATTRSEFGLPEAKLGLIPGAGGAFRLPRQIPPRVAMGHLLTGRSMPARRAYELGLVNDIVAPDKLDSTVSQWVADIVASAPLSVRAIKEAASVAATQPLSQAFSGDYRWERQRASSEDAKEGALAFAAKRPPRWTGH